MTAELSPIEEHVRMTRAARSPRPVAVVPEPRKTEAPASEAPSPGDPFAERMEVAGEMGARILDDLYTKIGDQIWLPCGEFKVMYLEELAEFGIGEDDEPYGPVYLKRKSDGVVFEVEVECDVRRLERKAAAVTAPGEAVTPNA